MVKLISKQIAVSTLEPSIRLDDVLRSYDLEDTQFEIKVLNEDLDLTDSTIHCVTKYFSHGKSYAFEKLIKPKSKDVIVFSLPEELKGYDGKIYVGIYAELGDERVDIKDIEVTINNSIIDDDIDFSTVNYFESFERMVEKVDLATEDALDNIKHDKEHVALSRDYAERKMDEDIEEVDTRAKEVLESINEKDKKVNELADKLNTDIEDFEQIKITAKETSDNAVREIIQTKDTVISEIESVSDSFKAKKTEFDTVVNGITTSIDTKVKDLGTYTEEQKLHIDEKTKSFNTLVDEKTGELTQLNNTFNQELEKSGVTLTTTQDLTKRVETLESKPDKDTIYDDTEIKQRIKALEDKPDTEPYDDSEIREMFNSIGEYIGDVLPTKLSDIDNKQSEHTKAIGKLKQDNLAIEQKISNLEQNSETSQPYDDTELRNRIKELESKEDKDTVYDDTAIKKELSELNQSIAKKKLYYAYAYEKDGAKGFTKADVYDWFYRELYPYFGISDKDSDNPNDYIWMPTRLASNDKLDGAIIEINKLKKLHEVRRAPTGYTLDRTTTPWTVWFDNGCGLQFPSYSPRNDEDSDGENTIYGFGYSTNISNTVPYQFPLPQSIIAASMGHISLLKFGKHDVNSFIYWDTNTKVLNPIRDDADKYDWSRCYGENGNDVAWKATRKTVFPRVCYELGIWSEADVLYLGATKK